MEYIIYHIIALVCLFLLYKLFFAKSRRFSLNRLLLLSFPVLPVLITLINGFTGVGNEISQVNPIQLDEVIIGANDHQESLNTSIDWLLIVYSSGMSLMFLFLIWTYYKTFRKIKNLDFKYIENERILLAKGTNSDNYSFFNYIVLGEQSSSLILEHEKKHVKSGHSFDILLYNIYKVLFWFNPFVYAFEKELKLTHEYEADAYASNQKEDQYTEDLLNQVFGTSSIQFINQFNNQNSIKMRIKMLKQQKKGNLLTYLGIIPLVSILFVLGSWESNNAQLSNLIYGNVDGEEVYDKVDKMPEFKGGMEGLIAYMQKNVKYPKSAEKKGTEGKVMIEFVVDSKGKVSKAKVLKGADAKLDQEALRVVNSMPNWNPGEKDGKKVSVKMVLPVVFKLK